MPRGPLNTNVYADPLLTNMSVDLRNPAYLSEWMYPELKVTKRTGTYWEHDNSKFRVENDLRAPGTESNTVDSAFVERSYGPLVEHALNQPIPDEVREEWAGASSPEEDATLNLTEKILLSKEKDAFAKFKSSANFASGVTLTTTDQWNEYGTSDPIDDMKTGINTVKKAILKSARELSVLMGYNVFDALKEHPQFVEKIKYSERGILTADIVAEVLGVKEVVVSEAEENAAVEGQSDSMDYISGNNVWIFYRNTSPAPRSISYGYTLRMHQSVNGVTSSRVTRYWREAKKRTDFVEVSDIYEHKKISGAAGYYIYDAI